VTVVTQPDGGGWVCQVEVEQAGEKTQHTVTVTPAALQRWGRGDSPEDVEDLVRRSFQFLLAREPARSILRQFDLSDIQRYFPQYDQELKR
jgi:hypothetical protein